MSRTALALVAVAALTVACSATEVSDTLDSEGVIVTQPDGPDGSDQPDDDPAAPADDADATGDDADDGTTDDAADDATDDADQVDDAADDSDDDATDDQTDDPGEDDDLFDPFAQHPVTAAPGRWSVGDAGAVTFALGDGGLELVDVVAADGWAFEIDEESADRIDVDFERENLEYQIEIDWDGTRLEVEIDLDIDPAEPGTFQVGAAGSVELGFDGSAIELIDVTAAEGWEAVVDSEQPDDVEVDFRSGQERWDFDADVDDGRLEIEIDYEVVANP